MHNPLEHRLRLRWRSRLASSMRPKLPQPSHLRSPRARRHRDSSRGDRPFSVARGPRRQPAAPSTGDGEVTGSSAESSGTFTLRGLGLVHHGGRGTGPRRRNRSSQSPTPHDPWSVAWSSIPRRTQLGSG
jgi:hypothetical protein